jgi:hypothetical protein
MILSPYARVLLVRSELLSVRHESRDRLHRGLYHPSSLQFDLLDIWLLEQSDIFTEQYGYEVNLCFVNKPGLYAPPSDIHAAR